MISKFSDFSWFFNTLLLTIFIEEVSWNRINLHNYMQFKFGCCWDLNGDIFFEHLIERFLPKS